MIHVHCCVATVDTLLEERGTNRGEWGGGEVGGVERWTEEERGLLICGNIKCQKSINKGAAAQKQMRNMPYA